MSSDKKDRTTCQYELNNSKASFFFHSLESNPSTNTENDLFSKIKNAKIEAIQLLIAKYDQLILKDKTELFQTTNALIHICNTFDDLVCKDVKFYDNRTAQYYGLTNNEFEDFKFHMQNETKLKTNIAKNERLLKVLVPILEEKEKHQVALEEEDKENEGLVCESCSLV